jgi:dihydrofolate synthase / folylpolyglutamate synthase
LQTDVPGASASLAEWLRWQETLHSQAIALGLERVRGVATRIGLPATGLQTVTVAGTNGKGSSAALLHEIYRAAGYPTGLYTSPHLVHYNERIVLNGRPATDAELCQAFAAIEQARGDTPLTFFEFGTLAALWLFRQAGVRIQILEVGLGGRLDAVNLVDADAVLITGIGLDHQDYLGPDRESIGREKAGVMRPGRPAVCSDPAPPDSISQVAHHTGAVLWLLDRDFRYGEVADAWNWSGRGQKYRKLPPPALPGAVQLRNAAGVMAVVSCLQNTLPVPETAIRAGLMRLHMPGRFERRGDLVLDVAHNVEAAQVLAENLRASGLRTPVRMVLGMLADKPVERYVDVLAPLLVKIHAAGLPGPRGLTGAALAERLTGCAVPFEVADTVAAALVQARAQRAPGETILVCGSFLTVGAVLEAQNG